MIEISICIAFCLISFMIGIATAGLAFHHKTLFDKTKFPSNEIDEHEILDGIGDHNE